MKANEYREMTDKELNTQLADLKEELFRLRFQLATAQLQNTNVLGECRRNIARVKTVLRERELAEAK